MKPALSRREILELFGGAATLAACATLPVGTDATPSTCGPTPSEIAGPYPADGTNGPNVLAVAGVERSDITQSFGGSGGAAQGVGFTVSLTLVNDTCQPVPGRAVYLWHCDRDGEYSMYAPSIVDENYLRGVQVSDASGTVTFTSVFPGCEPGRWPHLHVQIYASLADATGGAAPILTTQLALTSNSCETVYAYQEYSPSRANFATVGLQSDPVFDDGFTLEMVDMYGTIAGGYTASRVIALA